MSEPTAEDIGTAVLTRIREQEQQILILREELDRERAGRKYAESALRDSERRTWADGVWLVENHEGGRSCQQIGLLADLPDPVAYAAVARHQDAIAKAIVANRGYSISAMDLAGRIVAAVAEALHAEPL